MGVPTSGSGLRPFRAEPQDASQAEPLVPNATLYAHVVRSYAVLRDARRAANDSASWPRLSPGEARNIIHAFDEAIERVNDLDLALGFALSQLIHFEPGDSRAVSNEFVAMAAISCGQTERLEECRQIIRDASAIEARRAATGNTDAVHESATRQGDAHD